MNNLPIMKVRATIEPKGSHYLIEADRDDSLPDELPISIGLATEIAPEVFGKLYRVLMLSLEAGWKGSNAAVEGARERVPEISLGKMHWTIDVDVAEPAKIKGTKAEALQS